MDNVIVVPGTNYEGGGAAFSVLEDKWFYNLPNFNQRRTPGYRSCSVGSTVFIIGREAVESLKFKLREDGSIENIAPRWELI